MQEKYSKVKSPLTHFPPVVEFSENLMQLTLFYFHLSFRWKINTTMLAMYLFKKKMRSSFLRLRIIIQINRIH